MSMPGYREDIEEPEAPADPRRVNLLVGCFLLAFLFFLDTLSWLTERGGFFSIMSALVSVQSQTAVVNVDKRGLWYPFIILIWFGALGLCRLFNLRPNLSNRGKGLLAAFAVIGGALLLNEAVGEPMITRYMSAHGYTRCVAGDWDQGNGKSHVWFANYVLSNAACRDHQG